MIYRLWQASGGGGIDRLQLLVPHTLRLEVLRWAVGQLEPVILGTPRQRGGNGSTGRVGRMFTAAMSARHRKDPADAHAVAAVPNRGAHGEDRGDIMGPFPITEARNPFVLVAMDYFRGKCGAGSECFPDGAATSG